VVALCYALTNDETLDCNTASSLSFAPTAQSSQQQTVITALSQIAHCYAQGKIGSGFDVSAACFGSHVYRRFPETVIQNVMELLTTITTNDETAEGPNHQDTVINTKQIKECLRECVQRQWTMECIVEPLHVSCDSLLQVILADVSGGSESPGMARKVLQWKQSQADPVQLWTELAEINDQIANIFQKLLVVSVADDDRATLAHSTATEWRDMARDDTSCSYMLFALNQAFLLSRRHLKTMGDLAGVPIEPDAQTQLANATMQLPGVVACLCPGAGGFDALACVYIQDADNSVRMEIERFWAEWSLSAVSSLDVKAMSYGDGVRKESSHFD
jgi:phosphomevalonate kinase